MMLLANSEMKLHLASAGENSVSGHILGQVPSTSVPIVDFTNSIMKWAYKIQTASSLKPVVPTFQGRPESEDLNLNLRVSNWTRFNVLTARFMRRPCILESVCRRGALRPDDRAATLEMSRRGVPGGDR